MTVSCWETVISKPSPHEQALSYRDHAERLAVRAITVLKQTDINVRHVFERAQLTCSIEDFLQRGVRTIDPQTLHRLNAHALSLLATLANRQDGRPPIRPDDWAMLLYCLLSARTLRDAITRSVQFYRMLEERWGRLDLYVQGSDAELRIDSRRIQRNPIAFIVDTTGMTVLHGVFGWLIAEPIPVTTILLDYAETLRMHCDPALLPCPLELGADRAAMRFPSEYLDYPVVRTLDDFERRAGLSILFDQPENLAHAGVAERARRIMFGCLRERHDLPTLDELSAELNCNRARLRRNLSKAGVSYNSIKDSCRRELALDLLRRSRLSVEDIAIRLGFCDSDAFRRTFRHWMSMSPLQYRGIKGP